MGMGETGDEIDPFEELDSIEELNRELRRQVGGEFRRTAEEDEFVARKAALRRRSLAHIAYELLSRGDAVRVTIGGLAVHGTITHAHGDLATLHPAAGAEVHINLAGPVMIEVLTRAQEGGRNREQFGPETFLARLRELELATAEVEVLLGFTADRPHGHIEAVAADHLMLEGATTQFVPLARIGGVRRTARPHRGSSAPTTPLP